MLNVSLFEGKTREEAVEKALDYYNLDEEYLLIKELESEDDSVKIEVIDKADIKFFIKEYLSKLSELLNIDINTEIREVEGSYNVKLVSSNNSILIGKDGRTIAAIQTLLRKSLESQAHQPIKVNVDVANYKEKNLRRMTSEIKKIAYEVKKTHVDVELDPMNSYERREIHNMVDKIPNVTTESIGEGPARHIVIKYVEE
ncbi:MAG: KH domain-containing protein [Bacilli bacterium]|nr:KH domain-containing protein [Bacilli bacterium]